MNNTLIMRTLRKIYKGDICDPLLGRTLEIITRARCPHYWLLTSQIHTYSSFECARCRSKINFDGKDIYEAKTTLKDENLC